jgi:outer membrane protein
MLDVLVEAALRATLIAAASLVAVWLLRVRSAAVRHRLWTVVMLAMLALPFWIAYAPEVTLRVLPPTGSSASDMASPPSGFDAPSREAMALMGPAVAPASPGETAGLSPAAVPVEAWKWRVWLLAVYLAGVAVLLARLAIGTVRVQWLAREAQVVQGRLTSARLATPFTVGLLKPRILLPAGWDRWPTALLAAVLDHEHTHVRRHDPLVRWLALLNRALFWFHPLAWWLERHLAALAEEACDAAVLARGHSPADYAHHLLDLARTSSRCPLPHVVGMPMPGSALSTRIAKILEGGVGRPGSSRAVAGATVLATLAAAALGTFTLAQEAVQQGAQDPPPPRSLVEAYARALQNDPLVRQAETEYLALAETPPQARGDALPEMVTRAMTARAMTDYEAARQVLLIRVAEAYFNVLAAVDMLETQAAARTAIARQLEMAERRFEVGLISITALLEARAESDQLVANRVAAERALVSAQEALRDIVGEDVGELSRLIEEPPLTPPVPADAEEWVETAMQQNLALISARLGADIAAADDDIGIQRTARGNVERVARETERETRDAYLDVISGFSRVQALRQALRSRQTALEATQRGFEVGTRTAVDVVTQQDYLRRAETAFAHSRYDHVLNGLRLQRAAGGLTVESLEEVDSWLE